MASEKRLIDANEPVGFLKEQRVKETGAFSKGVNKGLNIAISALRNAEITPTVDAVEVVHGRWVVENEESIRCPNCCFNRASIKMPLNYCPNCGAKMDGGNEDG